MKTNRNIIAARSDLAVYSALMMPKYELAPHHRLLVEKLEAVERGEIKRLIITMPPRHGKSMQSSVLFPAHYLGRFPDRSIISASYGSQLATDFGRKVRNLIQDQMHRAIFPGCILSSDSTAMMRFNTTAGGTYFALGAKGPITGRGGDFVVLDDLHKNREVAYSPNERRAVQEWYEGTLYNRLEPDAAIVVIGTRWHTDDIIGWLLKQHATEGWELITLPAIAEQDDILGRQPGEALWPRRFAVETLEKIRVASGSSVWSALYQCRPVAAEGSIFKPGWFQRYDANGRQPDFTRIAFSLDTAFKVKESSDYSVCQVWGEAKQGWYLLHVLRERLDFPALETRIINLTGAWRPSVVLIEDAASGQSLLQTLQTGTRLPILGIKPQGDKSARASAISPLIEAGRVFIPTLAAWLPDFEDEVFSFPAGAHDDQVDAMTQALSWFYGKGNADMTGLRELHERLVWNVPRGGMDSFHRTPTTRLVGSCEAADAAEDAGGANCTGWGAQYQWWRTGDILVWRDCQDSRQIPWLLDPGPSPWQEFQSP